MVQFRLYPALLVPDYHFVCFMGGREGGGALNALKTFQLRSCARLEAEVSLRFLFKILCAWRGRFEYIRESFVIRNVSTG